MPSPTPSPAPKRIALACGGTGGHIHPALAVAERLRAQGHALALILSGTRPAERHAAESWQGPLLRSGARPITDPRNLLAILRCRAFLRRFRPDVLLATGGYTSFAPVLAARSLRIPVVLHEANALPGRAVRFLSKHFCVAAVATSYEETAERLPWARTVLTGLPLRQSVVDALAKARASKRPDGPGFHVLVTGGSQGAHGLNTLVAPLLASLALSDRNVRVTHQTGQADLAEVQACYAQTPQQVSVVPFIEDIGAAYAQADLAIARAGAATCAELARVALPAILIPLPTAADDHQRLNAQALVQCGGALCIDQSAPPEQFAEALRQLYSDPLLRQIMRDALADLPHPDATQALADLLLAAAE